MYQPDETHTLLDRAESSLSQISEALFLSDTIGTLLQMIMLSGDINDTKTILETIQIVSKYQKEIDSVRNKNGQARNAIDLARTAIMLAKDKIPNTTPPREDGLEIMPQ